MFAAKEGRRRRIRQAVGLADLCELMSVALRFPENGSLAQGLSGGEFAMDAAGALLDAGVGRDVFREAMDKLNALQGRNVPELQDRLRKGHSLLYLAPGLDVPVWPYEATFLFAEKGREGNASLFRSPVTLDVEAHMRAAGVLPKNSRRDPSDGVWNEFAFMSYLYGRIAEAEFEDRLDDVYSWSKHVVSFWDAHASKWLPGFMTKTIEEAPKCSFGAEYAVLAEVGLLVLDAICKDAKSRRAEA